MKEDLMNEIQRIAGVNPRKCMRCGKCSGACPAYDEMEYHPHQFVSMVEHGRIDELMASKGIYHLTPEQIPALLDDELPQQAITSAFRKYRK